MPDNNDKLAYNLFARIIKLYHHKSNIEFSILKNFDGIHMHYVKNDNGINYFPRIYDMFTLKLAITKDDCHSALRQHYPSFPR